MRRASPDSRMIKVEQRPRWINAIREPTYHSSHWVANNVVNRLPFSTLRHAIYRRIYGMRIGRNSLISTGVRVMLRRYLKRTV